MNVFKPSGVLRWPLHGLNVLLFFVIACLWGSVAIFRKLEQEPMWALVLVGSIICALFVAINLAITGMRLKVDDEGATLSVWFWKRRVPWEGMRVERETRTVGLTALRLVTPDGKTRIYLNPSWFTHFDDAVRMVEEGAEKGGGQVKEVSA